MTDLRITYRALVNDLSAKTFNPASPIEDLADEHPVVKAFVDQRSQSPKGSETTRLPRSKVVVYNLHSGRHRALTWHDRDNDVVWLLAISWHESGARRDAYPYFKSLDESDILLPTESDYELLDRFRQAQGRAIPADIGRIAAEIGKSKLAEAESQPGIEVAFDLGGILTGQIVVAESDLGDGFVRRRYSVEIDMPPNESGVVPAGDAWYMLVFPALLPRRAEVHQYGWRISQSLVAVDYDDIDEVWP